MTLIHSSSVIEPGAVIGDGCRIGPFCHIGPEVVLAENVELKSHVALAGVTEVGAGTVIFPFASVGHQPQDLKFRGERTRLVIGRNNRIREYTTLNPGTEAGGGETRLGDGNLLMMGTHVGHDCVIGNNVVMANYANLGGHCVVGDDVVIGALAGIHQFCRIGRGAMIGGLSAVVADVIPHGLVAGERAHLAGLNLVGLKRRGTDKAALQDLLRAWREMFESDEGSLAERVARVSAEHAGNELVTEVTGFLSGQSGRSFTMPG